MKREIKDDLFGSRLKAIRKRLKMLQAEFCDKLNISVPNLSEIENNKTRPGYDFFYKIVKEFDVNLNYLVLGEGPMFRKIGKDTGKGKAAGLDISRLGYPVNNEAVEEFLFYFFNSRFVHYRFLSELVRVLSENKDIIDDEIEKKKSSKGDKKQ
ncbi:MAG: helix-turn-helix domain-containing protein [Candidatus Aminicenantes bacterium]|nr:helix-turn-helix domain-containing protein [Candidatus Aminicenantes bacterium]NIM80593.1 helix-turn-helix domain-containing protein [Candidatus Aminicenantes bacterium]NIN19974.1 helix-turn-helix domain-containing protein [Candidatus Aminicenantes bacterium]NIN42602.1 helix-turn-helix domain-containing protein [Candidatus Aminicenantes bacterium]NIN86600.1 helix-turn-helix domain-containing protein [Candidatus Aminicenantes bacterium]